MRSGSASTASARRRTSSLRQPATAGSGFLPSPGPATPIPSALRSNSAPTGPLVPAALRAVAPAGVVVCAGIHMSDIPSFPYELLWQERQIRSVANLTRRDGEEFLALA